MPESQPEARLRPLYKVCALVCALAGALAVAHRQSAPAPSRALAGDPAVDAMIADPPARYAALDPEVQTLLAHSLLRRTLVSPSSEAYHGGSLWDYLDQSVSASQIQTLVEIHAEAARLGIWGAIESLRSIYAGTSWGIEFYGPADPLVARTSQSDLCHDIDAIVRRDHGNTRHRWWRSLTEWRGVGFAHLGLDDGEGFHNLHLDTLSPATRRGLPIIGGETCSYSVARVIEHNIQIRYLDDLTSGALVGFIKIEHSYYLHHRVLGTLDHDLELSPESTHTRWVPVQAELDQLTQPRDDLIASAHATASQPDGYSAVDALVTGPLAALNSDLSGALLDFADAIAQEGSDNGYFKAPASSAFSDLVSEIPLIGHSLGHGPTQEELDFAKIGAVRDKLREGGPLSVTTEDIDGLISVFNRVRAAR